MICFPASARTACISLISLILVIHLSAISSAAYAQSLSDYLRCDEPQGRILKGAVLVTHGLNNDPATLAPLCDKLIENGLAACRLTLAGHNPTDDMLGVTRQQWLEQYSTAYEELSRRYHTLPLYALGYSLGAAMTIHFLDENPEKHFKNIVLLAPPVSLRGYTSLLHLLTPLRVFNLSLPSAAPKGYRVHSFTSLAAYHATLDTVSRISKPRNPKALQRIPALVFLSRDDELISYKEVKQWLSRYPGSNWKLIEVSRAEDARNRLDHLIIDQASLGKEPWRALTAGIIEFFN